MNWRKHLAEILARMAEVKGEISTIEAIEAPTPEDATRGETLLTEWDLLEPQRVEAQAKVDQLDRIAAAVTEAPAGLRVDPGTSPQVMIRKDPFDDIEDLHRSVRAGDIDEAGDEIRNRAITAITEQRVRGVSDSMRQDVVRMIEDVDGAALHALAHSTPAYMGAWREFLRSQGQNPDYTPEQRHAMRTALNITTGASGQFSLPTLFDPSLIHTGTAAINPIRAISRQESGTQNVYNMVSTGNVTTYWHAEAAALTAGEPTLAHPVVTAGHLTAYVTGSWEFWDDSPVIAQLPNLIGEAMAFAESTAFITGSGTSQPLGIVTAVSATAGSLVTATTRGAFTSASSADVFKIVNAVASRYENTSSWIGNKATFNVIRQMSSSGPGSFFWGDLTGPVAPNPALPLLGSPAYNCSDVLSTTTTGTMLLVLGDFSQYVIYDRIGSTAEFIPNVFNSSGIPIGSRGLAVRKRVGANTSDVNAFRIFTT